MASQPEFPPIEGPTLGFLGIEWINAHCAVPDGFRRGKPLSLSGWQEWNVLNHYRVKPGATGLAEWFERDTDEKLPNPFVNRMSLTIRPQKSGKSPFVAAVICLEAVGPALVYDWAQGDEVYSCSDWGCDCGFE